MEGMLVENAFLSASVNGQTSSPAMCRLELVPTDTIRHIMPGTWVHVFCTDPWELNPKSDLSDFKLLFEGVVISRGFTRQDDGRNFIVECASPEIYWASARQFWLSLGSADGTIVDQLAIQTSGGYGRFGKVSSTGSFGYMINRVAFSRKNEEQAEERFIDTMVSVLDDIGNVNPYYTNARNRMRLTDRIIRAPAGKTEKLFQLALLSDFLDGISGRTSGQTDLVEVVNQLLSAILHEWVSIVAPPYIKARIFERDVFGNIKRKKQTVKRRGPRGRSKVDLYDFRTAEENIVASIMFKPHVYTIDPPNFNTLFPNMYDQMSYSENFMAETTRLSMKPQLPLVSSRLTSMMQLQRPAELEVFTALVRDPNRRTSLKRSPDGKYGDEKGQAPTFTDYDWTTNEERIRGIVYNFMNMAPAPSTLTLQGQGKKQPSGERKGGVPRYLQNVASYEYYKSKFMARQASVSGPFNMRPVPGFPMVILDDSDSKLNVICYLAGIQHSIDADGSAMTNYMISYPRIAGEVDYNRPRFKTGFNADGELDTSLARDENGNFNYETIFDGKNQPPVPEWFDERFRNTRDLDLQYKEWFGDNARVIQGFLFKQEDTEVLKKALEEAAVDLDNVDEADLEGLLGAGFGAVGVLINKLTENIEELEDIIEKNENIPIETAIDELNKKYRLARGFGKEFEEASRFTARAFTKIDEAFRFVGAAPLELRDSVSDDKSEKNRTPTFTQNPANRRVIDYKNSRLDHFVGDTSPGSGYAGATDADTYTVEDEEGNVIDVAPTEDAEDRMSGAFPVFDTKIHTKEKATDAKARAKAAREESGKSDRARYDGRPLMYDFEFRLWQQSIADAGLTPTGEEIAKDAIIADYTVRDSRDAVVRPRTPEERKEATKQRLERLEQKRKAASARRKGGKHDPTPRRCPNMPPSSQAPTGDDLEDGTKKPLTQPLSEKQVVDLRRSIIKAYREELKKSRGFTG